MGVIRFVPKNEIQTREWFAAHISESDYDLIASQAAFPDYVLADRNGTQYRVEVEHKSASFIQHRHDPSRCDFVLCWVHNASLSLPVIELSTGKRYEAGEINEAVPQETRKPKPKEKFDTAGLLEAIEGNAHDAYVNFLDCFAEDLKARSQFVELITPGRLKLLESARALTQALAEAGIDVGELHTDDLFALITL